MRTWGTKMASIVISKFSCIDQATFDVSPITVIIGPQGSGKSVTTKLLYFLADIPSSFLFNAEKRDSFDYFKKSLEKQFGIWFPASAWGCHRFNINYSNGPFSVRILRRTTGGKLADEVVISFSEWFERQYKQALELFEAHLSVEERDRDEFDQINDSLEVSRKLRSIITKDITQDNGQFISRQTFIPAGRAFFTSIGRIVAGLEQAGSLDPVTIKFARLFANLRDRRFSYFPKYRKPNEDYKSKKNLFMRSFFGGDLCFERDTEYVKSDDGRRIPFSSLSSGQQELLPMWTLLDYYNEMDIRHPRGISPSTFEQLYIEEPEAHLFPSAQILLMEFLVSSISTYSMNRRLIITTHSPYIMGKLNVFLKAGQLARRRKRNTEINSVIPRACWIDNDALSAYAIVDGVLKNIIDQDGLIDGTYLDDISEQNSREFSQLLQIESEM